MKRIITRLFIVAGLLGLGGCTSYHVGGSGTSGPYTGGGYISYGAYGSARCYKPCPPKPCRRYGNRGHGYGHGYRHCHR